MKKIVTHGRLYKQRELQTLRDYAPNIYPCGKCGSPVASGYQCGYCGDCNPNQTQEEEDAEEAKYAKANEDE